MFAAKIFIHQGEEEMKQIIKNEYIILKSFDYKYIVCAYEIIETQKRSIIIMEYVEGVPLMNLKYKNITS